MPKRKLTIEITSTGVIKIESGGMEGIGHNSVDMFLKKVADGLKTTPVVEKLHPGHTHSSNGLHEHDKLKH